MRAFPRLSACLFALTVATICEAAKEDAQERGPKSPEGKIRVTGRGRVLDYKAGEEIVIGSLDGKGEGKRQKFAIPHRAKWPHLGSVFFEVIVEPPPKVDGNFPVHSPMRPESVVKGMEVWYALEGVSGNQLELYQIACHVDAKTPALFNAVVRNAVKIRESREQKEIARDYQCRLIEAPKGSGRYPDDPAFLHKYVKPEEISAERLEVKAPPSNHNGYGRGLKSSDVYANGVGNAKRRKENP